MNKKEQEEYKKLGEKLICVPSGLKRKDGTDIMSWSLREWFEERLEEKINKIFNEEGDDETMSHVTQLFDEAFDKAEKRGGTKKQKEIAKAMKKNKLSYKIISQCTGLKLEEIEAL